MAHPWEVNTCRRPDCTCDHAECDRGWRDRPTVDGGEVAIPCPACRPDLVAVTRTQLTSRQAWQHEIRARRRAS